MDEELVLNHLELQLVIISVHLKIKFNEIYSVHLKYFKPVNVCKPAPTVEQNAPIIITHLLGQAKTATTNCLLILSPNLSRNNEPCVHEAKNITFDKSKNIEF